MNIVDNIRELCKESSTSIPKLEKELGFGNGAIYNWNKNSPSIDKLQKVADLFNVSVERVLYGFELSRFEQMLRIIVGNKPIEEVSKLSGVDPETLDNYLVGICTVKPELEFVERLAVFNPYEVLVRREDFMEAAGYRTSDSKPLSDNTPISSEIETIAAHHDGEDWTEEELQDIEEFKELVKLRRQLRKNKE
ncbi:helix-turn-helix domain-containing protein [Paenibacillus sp. FSL K6-0108]|uniref:helix-turn-helix domain-containing protein n=1 Tax=Paenibacillus sp. FSL K6-0108 TaxID=2921417 RepID=UPI003243CE9A